MENPARRRNLNLLCCWSFFCGFKAEKSFYGFASVFNDLGVDLNNIGSNFPSAHHFSPALAGKLGGVTDTCCGQDSLSPGTWKVRLHNKTAAITAASDLDFVAGEPENAAVNNVPD